MSAYPPSRSTPGRYSVTLEALKEQQHSLNMRLLLALQNHDEEAQAELEQQLGELQKRIDRMKCGVRDT
jgi:TolA-binding protein